MEQKESKSWYAIGLVFQLGFSLALPLVVGTAGGAWLDKKFSASPLFTLIGLMVGLSIAGYTFYIDMLPLIKRNKKK